MAKRQVRKKSKKQFSSKKAQKQAEKSPWLGANIVNITEGMKSSAKQQYQSFFSKVSSKRKSYMAQARELGRRMRGLNQTQEPRYCSLRGPRLTTSIRLGLAKAECLGLTTSEFLASSLRKLLAFPGRFVLRLLSRRGLQLDKNKLGALACALSLGMLAYVAVESFPNAYVVEMNGSDVAVVAEYKEVEDAVQAFLAQNSDYYSNIHYTDEVSYRPVRAKKQEISSAEEVALLCERMNFVAVGYKMYVDGQEIATLQNRSEGQALIDRIVESYKPDIGDGELTITEVRVAEKIEYKQMEVDIQDFTDPAAFESYLLHGEEVQHTYTVKKNDTLSQIASRFSLSTDDLRQANPRHQSEQSYLQVGEVLNLNLVEKPIHVQAKGVLIKKESIPFETSYKNDSNMWKGQYKTVEKGEPGVRNVEYEIDFENGLETARAEIGQEVVAAPKNKVVANGTKYMTPSRGGGNGEVAWPLRGRITSPFGWRSRGFHSGLDIASSSGSPVYAAGSGRVMQAAWSGNYGRLIKIDHGDGLETRYAHLSSFKVSYGDKVSRGDLIGTVGSTGRSTGPHLHFEVRINGAAKNPINYLD